MYISYRQILKQSWQIASQNKLLWLFGIFASFFALENAYGLILSQLAQAQDPLGFYQTIYNLYSTQAAYINNSLSALNLFKFDTIGFICLALVGGVIIFCIWLALVSQIFIIKSASLLYHGKKAASRDIWALSDHCIWQVLGLNILAKLVLYAAFLILALPLLYLIISQNLAALVYVNVIFFVVFIIFAVIVNFIVAYAVNFIVLQRKHVFEAVSAAWKLFKNNILISLEISATFFALKLISIILILSLFMMFLLPLGIMLGLAALQTDIIAIVLCLLILVLALTTISLFINSIFSVFSLAAWTITFTKLTEETLAGKIMSWINNLPNYLQQIASQNKVKINQAQIKSQAKKLAQEAESQAKIMAAELRDKYQEYKPTIKKQSKLLAKQAKTAYQKYQPIVKAESLKLAKEINQAYNQYEPILERQAKKLVKQAQKNWAPEKPVKKTTRKTKKTAAKRK